MLEKKEYGTYSLEVGFGTGSIIDREWKLINLDGGEDLIVNVKKKKGKGVSIKGEHMERRTRLLDSNFIVLDSTALDLGLFHYTFNKDDSLGLFPIVSHHHKGEKRVMETYRDKSGVLEHLLGYLVLIALFGGDKDTLESVGLLSESEKDNLGSCFIQHGANRCPYVSFV